MRRENLREGHRESTLDMRHSRDVKKMDSKKLVRVVGIKSRPEHTVLLVILARRIGTCGTTSRGG
jgi:hypothetical protein